MWIAVRLFFFIGWIFSCPFLVAQRTQLPSYYQIRDPTPTELTLQENFDDIFMPWKFSKKGYSKFQINRKAVRIGSYQYSGISFQMPTDSDSFSLVFKLDEDPPRTTRPPIKGFNIVSEAGKVKSSTGYGFDNKTGEIRMSSSTGFFKSGKKYALWFAFESEAPLTLACDFRPGSHRPSLGREAHLKLSRLKADELPLFESPPLGEQGFGSITIEKFVTSPKMKDTKIGGFRLRIPDPVPGHLILWYFDPDGRTSKMQTSYVSIESQTYRGSYRTPSTEDIVSNSVFKQRFPANEDRQPWVRLFTKDKLSPGEFQIVIPQRNPQQKRIGFAFNFSTGSDLDIHNYVPLHLCLPLTP